VRQPPLGIWLLPSFLHLPLILFTSLFFLLKNSSSEGSRTWDILHDLASVSPLADSKVLNPQASPHHCSPPLTVMAPSTPPTLIGIKVYYNDETRRFSLALKDLAIGTFSDKVRFLLYHCHLPI